MVKNDACVISVVRYVARVDELMGKGCGSVMSSSSFSGVCSCSSKLLST